jgi:hypothetical protein
MRTILEFRSSKEASLLHQLRTLVKQVGQFHHHRFRSSIFVQVQRDESLPECRSRNIVLQLVIDHYGPEIEEVDFRPGFIDGLRRNQPEPSGADGSLQLNHAQFIGANKEDGHAVSVEGALTGVNEALVWAVPNLEIRTEKALRSGN